MRPQNSPMTEEEVWTDENTHRLETYLTSIGNWPTVDSLFFLQIQWDYLANVVNVSNVFFLKMKVDELYLNFVLDELNSTEAEYEKAVAQPNSLIRSKITSMVDLIAREVERAQEKEEEEEIRPDTKPEPKRNEPKSPRQVENEPIETELSPTPNPETPKPLLSPSKTRKLTVPPQLAQTRRMSLDLMNYRPDIVPLRPETHKRTSSMSRPATLSTTNVNVITKPHITSLKAEPIASSLTKVPIKNRFKMLKTFKFLKRETKKPAPVAVKPEPVERPVLTDLKKSRRVSMVGENLPMYIKEQLSLEEKEPEVNSPTQSSISRKQSRLNNLLANSQSLYVHQKDVSSIKSGPTQPSNPSLYEDSNDKEYILADNEYILPQLFTKFYEPDDDIIRGIETIDEDGEFINVDSLEYDEEEDTEYLF